MPNLDRAHRELFSRPEDERFPSLNDLRAFCQRQNEESTDRWTPPNTQSPLAEDARVS